MLQKIIIFIAFVIFLTSCFGSGERDPSSATQEVIHQPIVIESEDTDKESEKTEDEILTEFRKELDNLIESAE